MAMQVEREIVKDAKTACWARKSRRRRSVPDKSITKKKKEGLKTSLLKGGSVVATLAMHKHIQKNKKYALSVSRNSQGRDEE